MFTLQAIKPWCRLKPIFYLFGFKALESQACKTIHNFVGSLFHKIRGKLKEAKPSLSQLNNDQNDQLSANKFESFVESVLKDQMNHSIPKDNLVSHEDLIHEMSVFLSVGYDTSKLTNAFILIILSMYPKIQQDISMTYFF